MTERVRFATFLLVTAFALAGCTGDDGAAKRASSTDTATATTPVDTGTATNHAPLALLKARIGSQELQATAGTVTAPPNATITFDASGSKDSDGDPLKFSWTVDGTAATGATATMDKSFASGLHTIGVSVSDGKAATPASIKVDIQRPVTPPPPPIISADPVLALHFGGSFAQKVTAAADNAAVHVLHKFNVTEGTKEVTVWLTWFEANAANNLGFMGDIDMKLKDPTGAVIATSAGVEYEYIRVNDTEKLIPGEWTIDLRPYITAQNTYSLDVLVWMAEPTVQEFTGTTTGKFNAGETSGFDPHKIILPDNVHAVAVRLEWADTVEIAACQGSLIDYVDYDLYVFQGTTKKFQSGFGLSCEFGFIDSADGENLGPSAEWDFRVAPFFVPEGEYTLVVEYV